MKNQSRLYVKLIFSAKLCLEIRAQDSKISSLNWANTSSSEVIDAMVGRSEICTPKSTTLRAAGRMALAYQLDAILQGPKNSRIPGPNPLPLPLVMDMHAYKTLCMGLYKS
jgi:hypothetical protein